MEKNKRAMEKRAEKDRLAKEEAERMKRDAADSISMNYIHFPFGSFFVVFLECILLLISEN